MIKLKYINIYLKVGNIMFDYEKLWKLLKDRKLKKVDLKREIGITPTTLAKLNRNENVSMDVLNRLCEFLECDIGDILEHVYTPYKSDDTLGTFSPNKKEDIHNWFSYLEGYSKTLVENELSKLENVSSLLDPFGGSGTTPLVGVLKGMDCYYCETNPVMSFIIKTKTEYSFELASDKKKLELFKKMISQIIEYLKLIKIEDENNIDFGGFEKYFEPSNLIYIKEYKNFISKNVNDHLILAMFKIALAGIAVNVSKMVRRGDLRYAKGKEVNKTNLDFLGEIERKLLRIYADLNDISLNKIGKSECLAYDARSIGEANIADVVITSPPYLNGTNYIRNTKLELKLLDFVDQERDLAKLHKKGIVAGINNVSVDGRMYVPVDAVKSIIKELDEVSYDSRIQKMIIAYFNDMDDVFSTLSVALKDQGYLIMDIGDSQFAGIHIPTHEILIEIASKHGFNLYENEIIRARKSKNGYELTQRILRFRLSKEKMNSTEYEKKAKKFLKNMTYQDKGRNWGHSWHSLCSYRGKLKPAIAYELVEQFTKPGDVILDPMGGVGTIPFEACLQDRLGISNDLSVFAFIVANAKLEKPDYNQVLKEVEVLRQYIELNKARFEDNEEVRRFGLNKKIVEYYHEETMKEILAAREFFKDKDYSAVDCLIMACILHILHGNRPYALSRKSHPLTPYAPTGDFVYKNLIDHLIAKINRSYNSKDTGTWIKGISYNYDIKDLPNKLSCKADIIITSPPFASSFKFYTQNWLRLWFSGWSEVDFKEANNIFFDNKQNKNMDIYYSYFQACSEMLKENGKMILHVGKSDKFDMSKELISRCGQWFEVISAGEETIQGENHGIVDIGSTKAHQFIFLIKK